MRTKDDTDILLIRPSGLVERLPARPPTPHVPGYARQPVERPDDRRRRSRPPGQPWRGRLVDRLV